jgi:hypothetical protein
LGKWHDYEVGAEYLKIFTEKAFQNNPPENYIGLKNHYIKEKSELYTKSRKIFDEFSKSSSLFKTEEKKKQSVTVDRTKIPVIKELMKIPSIGRKMAEKLIDIGILSVNDLKNVNPEELYNRYNDFIGIKSDRCVLYSFRCAVYYASNEKHDPEKLKWWNWKDKS